MHPYRIPRSLARLSWRSMMLCRISKTSCRSSLSSIREMEHNGSRNAAGRPAQIVLHLNPDVTYTNKESIRYDQHHTIIVPIHIIHIVTLLEMASSGRWRAKAVDIQNNNGTSQPAAHFLPVAGQRCLKSCPV